MKFAAVSSVIHQRAHAVQDSVHYAYFAPYTLDDHMALVSELQSDDRVRLQVLGETLDGHDIDMLQIGENIALHPQTSSCCTHVCVWCVISVRDSSCRVRPVLRTENVSTKSACQVLISDCVVISMSWRVSRVDLTPRMVFMTVGEPGEGKRAVWIVARQHPGESMAEWFMEGMLHALLDPYHGLSKELLKKAVFYIVRLAFAGPALAALLWNLCSATGHGVIPCASPGHNGSGARLHHELWSGARLEGTIEVPLDWAMSACKLRRLAVAHGDLPLMLLRCRT